MHGLSLTFARVRGAPIQAHVSLLLVFFFFLSPALTIAEPEALGFSRAGLVIWSMVTAILFVVSILLHELGHVFQARREGMEVHGVTLWALGGVAYLSGGTPSPGRDFRVAAAGPAVTALLAAGLTGLSSVTPGGLGGGRPALAVVDIVGRAQVFLLVFNLIPAYPLDGGRMFLAVLWRLRNNLTSASRTASAVGKAFGISLMVLAGIGLMARDLVLLLPPILRINSLTGLLIGYLVYGANRSPQGLIQPAHPGAQEPRPQGLVVADFMNRDFVITEPKMSISALLDALGRLQVRPIALVIEDGAPLGMISRHAAEQIPEAERETKTVADVMTLKDSIRTLEATDPLSAARRALEDGPETAVVLNEDVVVGLVSVSDLAHAMVLEQR